VEALKIEIWNVTLQSSDDELQHVLQNLLLLHQCEICQHIGGPHFRQLL